MMTSPFCMCCQEFVGVRHFRKCLGNPGNACCSCNCMAIPAYSVYYINLTSFKFLENRMPRDIWKCLIPTFPLRHLTSLREIYEEKLKTTEKHRNRQKNTIAQSFCQNNPIYNLKCLHHTGTFNDQYLD